MKTLVAYLFDLFKASNPYIAALIVAILGAFNYFLANGGVDFLGPVGEQIAQVISLIWLALQGSRTTRILGKAKEANASKYT